MKPAAATASIIMAALVRGVSTAHRRRLMVALHALVNSEQEDVADECPRVLRIGTWIRYEEVAPGCNIDAASYAFEILELMEEESDRLADFRDKARGNLSSDLW